MKKHISEEAQAARMRNLAGVNKTSIKESQNRSLGTLIDYKRAADGVAYGIVKEQHHYYIKKGGLNENLSVADFAYIGGLANITEFQYGKLSEAEKQRNMLFATINEAYASKVSKTGSKKKMLTEDKAGQEIEMAASKVDDLDAATDAAEVPAEPAMPADDGSAEMDAGLDAMGGEELPADDEVPAPEGGEMGGEELPADDEVPAPEGGEMGGEEEVADDEMGGEEEVAVEDPETEVEREIEKNLGKITNQLRKTELTDSQIKSYVNTFLSAFKDKFPDVDIEDRKAMAEKITKVVPPEDIEDLGQNVEDTEGVPEPEEEMAEQQCAECGGFAQYAESRGYTAESIMECGEEEMTNLVSGYANAHSEGQNDGDFKAIALFITPEILGKLRGEYGHDEFANQVEPFSTEMNEASEEDRQAQINELFGGLKNLGRAAGQGIAKGAQAVGQGIAKRAEKVGQGIADKTSQVKQAVGQAATNIKQTYHAGELGSEVKKLEKVAADLGAQIGSLNKRMQKAGGQPINVGSILTTIKNHVAAGSTANLGKFSTVQEEGIPVDHTEVQPPLEEDITFSVNDKKGKPLSPKNVPVKELKEGEEPEEEEVDIDNLDVDAGEEDKEEVGFVAGFEPMGGGVVKPDGAATTVEVTKDSVNVTMNESEKKLRKYIRNRLEEHAGIKKPSLNENVKSEGLKKLDRLIDKQFGLYESKAKKKVNEELNEILGFSVKEKFAKLDPNNQQEVEKLFVDAFKHILTNPKMAQIGRAAQTTSSEEKYNLLKQYVEGNGGTLRLGNDRNTLIYMPQSVKDAATRSMFTQGGTQGKTSMGGV
jgi:hypothetical protein